MRARLTEAERRTLREVYETGGSNDYPSTERLLALSLIRWDGTSNLYRTTVAGLAALRGDS